MLQQTVNKYEKQEQLFPKFKSLGTAERPKWLPQSNQVVYIKYMAYKDNSCGEKRVISGGDCSRAVSGQSYKVLCR